MKELARDEGVTNGMLLWLRNGVVTEDTSDLYDGAEVWMPY